MYDLFFNCSYITKNVVLDSLISIKQIKNTFILCIAFMHKAQEI